VVLKLSDITLLPCKALMVLIHSTQCSMLMCICQSAHKWAMAKLMGYGNIYGYGDIYWL